MGSMRFLEERGIFLAILLHWCCCLLGRNSTLNLRAVIMPTVRRGPTYLRSGVKPGELYKEHWLPVLAWKIKLLHFKLALHCSAQAIMVGMTEGRKLTVKGDPTPLMLQSSAHWYKPSSLVCHWQMDADLGMRFGIMPQMLFSVATATFKLLIFFKAQIEFGDAKVKKLQSLRL